jgi:hypothetical protein
MLFEEASAFHPGVEVILVAVAADLDLNAAPLEFGSQNHTPVVPFHASGTAVVDGNHQRVKAAFGHPVEQLQQIGRVVGEAFLDVELAVFEGGFLDDRFRQRQRKPLARGNILSRAAVKRKREVRCQPPAAELLEKGVGSIQRASSLRADEKET